MKRLLVTGGTGYLGRKVVQLACKWEVTYTWFRTPPDKGMRGQSRQIDLRDSKEVRHLLSDCHPDAIIHTACSDRHEEAIVPAAQNITDGAAQGAIRLVYVSTDMVLDGNLPPYYDEAPPCPVSSYGRAKAEVERLISDSVRSAAIVRTSLIFGVDPLDRQTRWLVDGLKTGRDVHLFSDEYRCPIWVNNLAEALLELANGHYSGLLNVAGTQSLNRWQFGMMMLSLLGLQAGENVKPAKLAESGMLRPPNLTLDTCRARRLMQTQLLTVEEAIKQIHAARAP